MELTAGRTHRPGKGQERGLLGACSSSFSVLVSGLKTLGQRKACDPPLAGVRRSGASTRLHMIGSLQTEISTITSSRGVDSEQLKPHKLTREVTQTVTPGCSLAQPPKGCFGLAPLHRLPEGLRVQAHKAECSLEELKLNIWQLGN